MKQKTTRPDWDEIWSTFAEMISKRSVDPKHKVGAVIVNSENTQVLSIGYNGDQKGGPNKRESLDKGHSGFIHAEINSLIKMDYNNPCRKKMYVTLSPCEVCAKAIVNAGIDEVIFNELYGDGCPGIDILSNAGIVVKKYCPE
jgi:dCMP deaminase